MSLPKSNREEWKEAKAEARAQQESGTPEEAKGRKKTKAK